MLWTVHISCKNIKELLKKKLVFQEELICVSNVFKCAACAEAGSLHFRTLVWNKTNWSTVGGSLSDKVLAVCTWNLFGFIVLGLVFIFKFLRCSVMTVRVFKFPSPSLQHISSEGQGYKELGSKTDTGFVPHFLHALLPYRVTQSQWPWRNHDPWLTKIPFFIALRSHQLITNPPCDSKETIQNCYGSTSFCKRLSVNWPVFKTPTLPGGLYRFYQLC